MSFLAAGKCQLNKRANIVSTRGQSSIPASLGEAKDLRQAVKPARAQPLYNGNTQSNEPRRGDGMWSDSTTPNGGATEERGETESACGGWNVAGG